MRMLFLPLLVAAGGIVAPAQAETAREALLAVGQISQITAAMPGDVMIVHRNGHREVAQDFDYLADGDQLVLRGSSAIVALLVKGLPQPVVVEASRQRVFRVSANRQSSIGERVSAMLARFDYLFSDSASQPMHRTAARGPGDGNETGKLEPIRSVISGTQLLPPGDVWVSPTWSGRVASLRVEGHDGVRVAIVSAAGKSSVAVSIEAEMSHGTLVAESLDDGSALHWPFRRAEELPRDPDLRDAPATIAALWFATEGPPEWRLYGLSQLRALSVTDFAARRLWEAELAGLLQPQQPSE